MKPSAETYESIVENVRNKLVDDLVNSRQFENPRVAEAMRTVPRHLFIPEATIRDAYADDVVVTKRNEQGKAISSASAPWIVGLMLDKLDVQPGHRILEIGAGTGYNAALLGHLVGRNGHVTTVDFDQDISDRARSAIMQTGCENVSVLCGDGEYGFQDSAPYDRIIVTVGVADLPPAWWDQLASEGKLVVPLRIRGAQRIVAFDRCDYGWSSTSIDFGGFMPIRGGGANATRRVVLHRATDDEAQDLTLQIDENQVANEIRLAKALNSSCHEVATGSHLLNAKQEFPEWLELWLMHSLPSYSHIGPNDTVIPSDLVNFPYLAHYNPAVFNDDSFAYLTWRNSKESETVRELVVRAHGPTAKELAEEVANQVAIWEQSYRHVVPSIQAHYEQFEDLTNHQNIIEKKHVRITFQWEQK